jgi:hypothetical protein
MLWNRSQTAQDYDDKGGNSGSSAVILGIQIVSLSTAYQ